MSGREWGERKVERLGGYSCYSFMIGDKLDEGSENRK